MSTALENFFISAVSSFCLVPHHPRGGRNRDVMKRLRALWEPFAKLWDPLSSPFRNAKMLEVEVMSSSFPWRSQWQIESMLQQSMTVWFTSHWQTVTISYYLTVTTLETWQWQQHSSDDDTSCWSSVSTHGIQHTSWYPLLHPGHLG